MSSSNCYFLTCISQEAGQVVSYSHLLKKFPEFVVVHTSKGFVIVSKAEIDNFLELSCFFCDPADIGNLISGSSAFSKSNYVWLFTTPWTVIYQAPLSMEFCRKEYWSGLPFPSPGNLPNPGIKPRSPTLQADTLLCEPPGKHLLWLSAAYSHILGISHEFHTETFHLPWNGLHLLFLFLKIYLCVFNWRIIAS